MAMQPMRRGAGGNMFGRGGPLSAASAAAKLAIGIIAASVLVALVGALDQLLVLRPGLVINGFVWQPLTYAFIALQPFSVLIGALIVWSIGGQLEASWGAKRFLWYAIGATALSGLLTSIVALFWPAARPFPFEGPTVMLTAIWLAYGWSFGRAQMQMMLFGAVSGNTFAIFGIVLVGIKAAFARSLVPVMPELFAIGCAYVYVKVGSPRLLLLRAQKWRLDRTQNARRNKLRVISDDRNGDKGSDRYIH